MDKLQTEILSQLSLSGWRKLLDVQQAILVKTGKKPVLGSMYVACHKLERDKLIVSAWEDELGFPPSDRIKTIGARIRFYKLADSEQANT